MADRITYQQRDRIAELTLDDGKLNTMTLPFFEVLNGALDRAEGDGVGAVVITGRPGAYSAGLDLKVLPTLAAPDLRTTLVTFARTLLRVFTFPIPTLAAVSGHAIAGGAFLAFACDLRFMAEGPFRLHVNEVAIGLPLPSWAIAIAHSAIPRRWHTEALLHARPYSPAEACERGMLDGVTPAGQLVEAAHAAAAPLMALDQRSYALSKTRHRARVVKWAADLVETEMTGLPARRGS